MVQIGGRTPERIPEVAADGKITGWRTDRNGRPLTTELSADGEKQLAAVAEAGEGKLVRAEHGTTGIDQIAAELKKQMRSELGEKVETVYADVYYYPLVTGDPAPRRRGLRGRRPPSPLREAGAARWPPRRSSACAARSAAPRRASMRRPDLLRAVALGLALGVAVFAGCSGWDPRSPFEHNAPEVDEALRALDAGRVQPAERSLERYLGTGPCSADAGINLSPSIRQKPSGTFDLGLTLFALGEQFGHRFGDEEGADGGSQREQALAQKRALEVGCALLIVRAIAADPTVPTELRARAHYLAGNLEFLLQKYEDAVKEYDQALALVPGLLADAGGDGIGRDAAWNRAIALRRQEDQKDAGNDAPDSSDAPDASDAADSSDGNDGADGSDGNDGGGGSDGGDKGDAGKDGGERRRRPATTAAAPAAEQPPPAPASATPQQDNRILEQLEQAPSYQGQEAKKRAAARTGRPTMEDK